MLFAELAEKGRMLETGGVRKVGFVLDRNREGVAAEEMGWRRDGVLIDGRGRLGREGKTGKSASCWRRTSRWWELWVVSWGWGWG